MISYILVNIYVMKQIAPTSYLLKYIHIFKFKQFLAHAVFQFQPLLTPLVVEGDTLICLFCNTLSWNIVLSSLGGKNKLFIKSLFKFCKVCYNRFFWQFLIAYFMFKFKHDFFLFNYEINITNINSYQYVVWNFSTIKKSFYTI